MQRWLFVLLVLGTVLVVPRRLAGIGAQAYFDGDVAAQDALARTVREGVLAQHGPTVYRTGMSRFDGQATIAIDEMALLGLGQVVLAHPELREAYLPAMREAGRHLADPRTLAYAAQVYGHNGLDGFGGGEGHAYLGYVNLGLGMLRLIDPGTKLAAVHDRLTAELTRRLDASPTGLIETYPGETWPPDVAAVAGSIGLHARATKTDRTAMLARWATRFEACALDASGWVVQRTQTGSCKARDAPRGSGTAIAAYFLSFATPELARKLGVSLFEHGGVSVLGLGGVREYLPGTSGSGDVNAGPIVFGISVGATGFGLASARQSHDETRFRELFRSTNLFGVPTSLDGRTSFIAGGLLGNALLLAMVTAA